MTDSSLTSERSFESLGNDFEGVFFNEIGDGENATVYEVPNAEVESFAGLDFAGVFSTDTQGDFHVKHVTVPRCTNEKRSYRQVQYNTFQNLTGHLVERGASVNFEFNELSAKVGVVKRARRRAIPVDGTNCLRDAEYYSEEVCGKGSGLAFSNLVHNMAMFVVCSVDRDCFFEPVEGNDLTFTDADSDSGSGRYTKSPSGLSIEVTGCNYETRATNADWVLNKYLLLSAVNNHKDVIKFMELSRKEETNDTSGFIDSNWNCGTSPYTAHVDEFHRLLPQLGDSALEFLKLSAAKWFLLQKPHELPAMDTSCADTMTAAAENGSKLNNFEYHNGERFPSRFRVLPRVPIHDLEEIERRSRVEVTSKWTHGDGHSTYHTSSLNDESYVQGFHRVDPNCTYRILQAGSIPSMLYSKLSSSRCIQAINLESELMQRIDGSSGFYYSKHANAGICWHRRNKDAVIWDCRYYTFEEPGDEKDVGIWSRDGEVWRSPCFKVNRGEKAHAIVLPGKCSAVWVSIVNASPRADLQELAKSMCLLAGTWRDSSWETSRMCSASRFKTTGHFGGNGNFVAMINKTWTNVSKMRSSTYLCYRLDLRHLNEGTSDSLSPMFRFPFKLHCLEKDMCHGMFWHIRPSSHEVDCCTKMVDGLSNEINIRDTLLEWYELQVKFMGALVSSTVSFDDYAKLMSSAPLHPTFCVPLYIGLTVWSKRSLEVSSSSQTNTGFTLNGMVSDRGSCVVKNNIILSSKMATTMSQLVSDMSPTGPYTMLLRCSESSFDGPVYTISAKDDDGGDREISTMQVQLRPKQFFSESMHSTVSSSMPEDALLKSEKYNDMVNGFMNTFASSNRGVASSEDRSFFCGEINPEFLSVASLSVAIVIQSHAMVSASSVQRLNRFRDVVLPPEYKSNMLPENIPRKTRLWKRGDKVESCVCIRIHQHMLQGIEAVAAGVMNTVYNVGFSEIAQYAVNRTDGPPDIMPPYIITTSDDVGRAFAFSPKIDVKKATELTIYRPLGNLHYCMMKNNWKKLVVSTKKMLTEVNNVTSTASGMCSQSPIYAALGVQPFNGIGPLHDIISAVSNSRAGLWWGNSPSECIACLEANLKCVKERWRMTTLQMDQLSDMGLIPDTPEELLEGFFPRSKSTADIFWYYNSADNKRKVIEGTRSLYTSFLNKCCMREEDPEVSPLLRVGLETFDRKLSMIEQARAVGGRLRIMHTKGISLKRLVGVRTKMFAMLDNVGDVMPDSLFRSMAPTKVSIRILPFLKSHRRPCTQGDTVAYNRPDRKRILLMRKFNIAYRLPLTNDEMEICKLSDEDFLLKQCEMDKWKSEQGFAYASPGGLPVVTIMPGKVYKTPQSFRLQLDVDAEVLPSKIFAIRGVEVPDFKPCLWGGSTLAKSEILSFGTGTIEGKLHCFYKISMAAVRAIPIEEKVFGFADDNRRKIYYVRGTDVTPITEIDVSLLPVTRSNLFGDVIGIANYGGWLQCSDYGAFRAMSTIYQSHGSELPMYMRKHFPTYPLNSSYAPMGNASSYMIQGVNTRRIKLEWGLIPISILDATGAPEIRKMPVAEEEMVFE